NPSGDGPPSRPSTGLPATRPMQLPRTSPSPESAPSPAAVVGPPAPNLPVTLAENLSNFDDRLADLHWTDGHWQLSAGSQLLKDFGRRESDARKALALIRELHLTQHGTIGSPRPIVEYWLSDGRVPTEALPGLRTMPVDRTTLRAEQVQGFWCVRDERSTFFNFGSHRDEAEQTVAIVKHYAFDRLALVGQPTPVMLLFLGPPVGNTATAWHSPPPPKGRVVTPVSFESTTEAIGDVAPSLLQSSHLRSSTALAPTPAARASDSRSRQTSTPSNDVA